MSTRPDPVAGPDDLYALLGVRQDASTVEITRAYRRAMKRSHPDRQPEADRAAAETEARRLNDAYATLTRPDRRRRYDASIRQRAADDAVMGRYVNAGFNPDQVSRAKAEAVRPRIMTAAEQREMRQAERAMYTSLGVAFGGFVIGIVVVVIAVALLAAVLRAVL